MSILYDLARYLHLTPSFDPSLIVRNVAYFSGTDAHVNHKLDIFLPCSSKNLSSSSVDEEEEESEKKVSNNILSSSVDEGEEPQKNASNNLLSSSADEGEKAQKKIPVIVHIHGGGWVRGSRTNEWRGGPSVGRTCAKEGFIGVVVSYRLARISPISFMTWSFIFGLILLIISLALLSWQLITGYIAFMTVMYIYHFLYKVRIPVNLEHMMDDLCLALIYIRNHIHEHCPQADPDQIFLSGHSAGAHLISLLVLDKTHLQRHDYPVSSIRGVIAMSGVYTLANPTHDSKYNIKNLVFRALYSSNLRYPEGKTMFEYSPIEYIKEHEELPPFLVMSARFDMGLEVDARRFVERFRKYNYQVDYYIIGGMTTHGTIASKFSKNDAHRHFFTFIRQNMK